MVSRKVLLEVKNALNSGEFKTVEQLSKKHGHSKIAGFVESQARKIIVGQGLKETAVNEKRAHENTFKEISLDLRPAVRFLKLAAKLYKKAGLHQESESASEDAEKIALLAAKWRTEKR